ncbi:hypothetical protein J7T55_014910 [Diaporthe amygdali]|uniref:uncharacterized protein n=1 Tax=Phomopsis amygdali TaxID=1214568 RepID=UPI0022FEF2AD|nr:uncharacterized protein J7T55_014910 [Diaporthe amygdali]KAJ0106835.1 hypothetical protein J7T55_014910 [Diaporthe amygdali]
MPENVKDTADNSPFVISVLLMWHVEAYGFTMSFNRDSEGTYQDDLEDATMASGQSSKDRPVRNAGQSSHERRKNEKQAEKQN